MEIKLPYSVEVGIGTGQSAGIKYVMRSPFCVYAEDLRPFVPSVVGPQRPGCRSVAASLARAEP
jgi:hypothetical protein